MFKSALSSLGSSITGAAKATIQSYKPTPENLHGSFNRIAEQGIANLSYRSPIMSDIAQTMLQSFQFEIAKKDKINKYVKSDKSADFRSEISAQLGDKASSKAIDIEMKKVLEKITKSIEETGQAKTMESDLFKKYGKHFDDFKKETTKEHPPEQEVSGASGGMSEAHLIRIENNTLRTVDVLEGMTQHGSVHAGGTAAGTEPSAPKVGGGSSFIDPYTGMPSVKAAIGSIGGSFLAKVFDDDLLEKYAGKVKGLITPKDGESTSKDGGKVDATNAVLDELKLLNDNQLIQTDDQNQQSDVVVKLTHSIFDELKSLNSTVTVQADDQNQQSDVVVALTHSVLEELKRLTGTINKTGDGVDLSAEDIKEGDTKQTNISNVSIKLAESTVEELKKLNENVTKLSLNQGGGGGDSKESSLLDTAGDLLGGKGGMMKKAGSLAMRAAPALGSVAAVGAAGVAGYQFGKHVVNPLINSGISAMTGEDTTLGGWIYDKMHPNEGANANAPTQIDPAKMAAAKAKVEAAKSNQAAQVEAATTKAQAKAAAPAAPIVIAPSQNISGGTSGGGTTILAASSVRNQDSTFERVQMQDFWNRTS
jgi:hypothetical protein